MALHRATMDVDLPLNVTYMYTYVATPYGMFCDSCGVFACHVPKPQCALDIFILTGYLLPPPADVISMVHFNYVELHFSTCVHSWQHMIFRMLNA